MLAALVLICTVSACVSHPGGPTLPDPSSTPASSSTPVSAAAEYVTRIINFQTSDGERTSRIHHPTTAKPGAPLIVMLHPATVSALDTETNYGWDTIADRYGLIVAYPDGLLDGFSDTWNGGLCCPPASELKTDDVGFLDKLVTDLRLLDRVGADVYAVGFSNGAIMAYAWECAEPGELAGLGVVAGARMVNCPRPAPISLVALHGTADLSIPIKGGPAPDGASFPPLKTSITPFRAADKCTTSTALKRSTAEITNWACAAGHHVVLDIVTGLDHSWPGAGPHAGTTDGPLDATGFLWAHLRPTS